MISNKRSPSRFLALFLFVFILVPSAFTQPAISIYDNKDSVYLVKDSQAIIVLAHSPSCLKCYEQIATYLKADSTLKPYAVYVLIHDTTSAVRRKSSRQLFQSFFKDAYPYYYTSRKNSSVTDSFVTREVHSAYFPSMIIIKGSRKYVLSYTDLFTEGMLNTQKVTDIIQGRE